MTESPNPLSCTLDEYTDAIFRSDSERASFFDDTSFSSSFLAKPDVFTEYDDWTPRVEEQKDPFPWSANDDDLEHCVDPHPLFCEYASSPTTASSLSSLSRSSENECGDEGGPKRWRKSMMLVLRARRKHRAPEHVETPTILRPLQLQAVVVASQGGGEPVKRWADNRSIPSRGKKGNRLLKKLRTPSDIARAIHQNEVNASLLTQTKNRDEDVKFINPLFALSNHRKSFVLKEAAVSSTTTTATTTAITTSTTGHLGTVMSTITSTTSSSTSSSASYAQPAQPAPFAPSTPPSNNAAAASSSAYAASSPSPSPSPSTSSSPGTSPASPSSSPIQERRQQDTRVPANPLFRKFIPPGGSYEAAGQLQPTRSRSSASTSPRTLAPVIETPASTSFPALQRILDRKPSKDKPKKMKPTPKQALSNSGPNRDCSREWRSFDDS